jgi:hypothetical protein
MLSWTKNIAYHDTQVSFLKGTNGLNIALLKVEDVEHYLLGRLMRLNGPRDVRSSKNLKIPMVIDIIFNDWMRDSC